MSNSSFLYIDISSKERNTFPDDLNPNNPVVILFVSCLRIKMISLISYCKLLGSEYTLGKRKGGGGGDTIIRANIV